MPLFRVAKKDKILKFDVLKLNWLYLFLQQQIVSKPLAPCQNPSSYSNDIFKS